MLVLSRKPGEAVVIGDDIILTVKRISGSRVTISVQAPTHVKVLRGELEPFDSGDDDTDLESTL